MSDNTYRISPRMLILAAVLFAAIAMAYFSKVLGGSELLTERDLSVFFIPPRLLWVEQVLGLELPLWNPYTYGGQPLFATLQPGILYPVNLLLLALPFDVAFNWTVVIHFAIAPVCMYLLAREAGSSAAGSLLAGLTFMLSGYLFSVHNVISTLFTASWGPLAVFFHLRAIRRGSTAYAIATGATLAMMFMAGGIEALFATLVLLGLLFIMPSAIPAGDAPVTRQSAPGRRISLAATAVVVFLSLSAVQLIPFLELAGQSTRAGGLTYQEATTWSLASKDFIQFFIPDPFGYGASTARYWANQSWLKSIYIGVIPVVLSLFFIAGKRRKAIAMALIFLAFLVLAMGGNTPLYRPLYDWLPFFNKFRYPVKFLYIDFLILSIAVALGYDHLKASISDARGSGGKTLLYLLALSMLGALAFGVLSFKGANLIAAMKASGIDVPDYNSAEINVFNAKRLFFFMAVFPLCVYFLGKRLPKALPWAVCLLLGIDLFFAHSGYYVTTKGMAYHAKGAVMEFLSNDNSIYRTFVTPRTLTDTIEVPDDGTFSSERLRSINLDKERLLGYNIEHHVQDAGGVEVMRRGDYMSVYEMAARQSSIDSTNILSMLNVKYVISIPPIKSPSFALRLAVGAEDGLDKRLDDYKTVKVYENMLAVPRFYIAKGLRIIKTPEELARRLTDKGFDPNKETLLTQEPSFGGKPLQGFSGKGDVKVISYHAMSATVEVNTTEPSVLVAAENWYPGWKAAIDGVEEPILKANYIQRAVVVPAGTHTVRFFYRPASFMAGAAVSGIGLFSLVVYAAYRIRCKRMRPA